MIRRAGLVALAGGALAFSFDRLLMTWKWLRLLRARGFALGLVRGVEIYCASLVWGFFLPATLGADAIRALCTRAEGLPGREVVASMLIERALGMIVTPVVALGSLTLFRELGGVDPRIAPLWWLAQLVLLGALLVFLASLNDTLFGILHGRLLRPLAHLRPVALLREFHEVYRGYRAIGGELGVFSLLTLAEQLATIAIFWGIARGLAIEVGPLEMAAAVPLAFLASRLPISLGGLGVFEGVLVLVLAAFGVSSTEALSIALVGRVLQIVAWLPWWASYSLRRGSFGRPRAEAQPG